LHSIISLPIRESSKANQCLHAQNSKLSQHNSNVAGDMDIIQSKDLSPANPPYNIAQKTVRYEADDYKNYDTHTPQWVSTLLLSSQSTKVNKYSIMNGRF
jgi:hypothetical protein